MIGTHQLKYRARTILDENWLKILRAVEYCMGLARMIGSHQLKYRERAILDED